MIKLINKLNGWQRIYLIFSVVTILFYGFNIIYEVSENTWKINKPSKEFMRDASFSYEKYVRKQTYEQYLATYEKEFKAFLENEKKKDTVTNRFIKKWSDFPRDSDLPEYRAMSRFLRSKDISVNKGLSLKLNDKSESVIQFSIGDYNHGWYQTMREQFPEFSEQFDLIDNSLKKENRYTTRYIKQLAYYYLLLPLSYFALVILFLTGLYLLLTVSVKLIRWVMAGFKH